MTTPRDPRAVLPSVMHAPVRLAILASLRRVESASFAVLRDRFALTAPEMSRQLAILEREGLVEVLKSRRERQTVTEARLSERGRTEFDAYLATLEQITNGLPVAPKS